MYVLVSGNQDCPPYKSMVYGLLNTGCYEQAIVINPYEKCFLLMDYLNKDTRQLTPRYQCINSCQNGWITCEKVFLLKLKAYCRERGHDARLLCFRGYPEVFYDFSFLLRLMRGEHVPVADATIPLRTNEDAEQWNYIRTQQDADALMELFAGFHDSTLNRLTYEEEYGKAKLTALFDNSGWFGVIELCFEGLLALNLRPPLENCSREIFSATLLFREESVFWADDELTEENPSGQCTWIKALNLKWRQVK